jgi:hypothetical protein
MTNEQREEFKDLIITSIAIELAISGNYLTDLSDIANCIGMAVSKITCEDGKDLNLWSFQKDDFISGFNHGYSLNDGTH